MGAHAPAASEAAIKILTRDYVNYHLAFGAGGTLVVLAAIGLAAICLRELILLRRARPADGVRFAGLAHAALATVGLLTAVVMTILVWANIGNALAPAAGLADAIGVLSGPAAPPLRSEVQEAGAAWLNAGDAPMPAIVKRAVDKRLAWQAPKAAISLIALIFAARFAVLWWKGLIRQSRRLQPASRISWTVSVAVGWLMIPTVYVLIILSLANAQASIAPIVLTLTMG